jgi:hypothetical protein
MKNFFIVAIVFSVIMSSCSTLHNTMREPNVRVVLTKADFNLSEQFSAKARSTRILGIDFNRIFKSKTGDVKGNASGLYFTNIPVVGSLITDKTANYALYELMHDHSGYDFVMYPQYEMKVKKPILGIGGLLRITKVKVIARLGKLKQ